jgi:hypothetical protein
MIAFHECAICRAKPGTPSLCASCVHNRATIDRLHGALRLALNGWASSVSHSGWSGSDLMKIDMLRKEFNA